MTTLHGERRHLLTVDEAADELRCHPETLRRAVRKGCVVATRIGPRGRLRFRREDLGLEERR